MSGEPPPATGVRLQWVDVPEHVRNAVDRYLGSTIVSATVHTGGFSPGFAGKIVTADSRAFFAKAVSPAQNPDTPSLHRKEAKIVSLLPSTTPVPELLWTYDGGTDGWILLLFEHVDGYHPPMPWTSADVDRVLAAMGDLAAILTPSPVSSDIAGTAADAVDRALRGWNWLSESPPPNLDAWSRQHLDGLAALEAHASDAVKGDTLLHLDIRGDNLLFARDRVWFLDWPHACVGAAWLDVVGFAPSVAMQGGPSPQVLIDRSTLCRAVSASHIDAAVATLAGYFTHRSLQPAPTGLPTVRAFQAAQGKIARQWLSERFGWAWIDH